MCTCFVCTCVCVTVTQSCLFVTPWIYSPRNSPGQNTRVGSRSLLQEISPTRDQSPVSHIAGRFFISWASREAQEAQEYWSGQPPPSPADFPNPKTLFKEYLLDLYNLSVKTGTQNNKVNGNRTTPIKKKRIFWE